MDTVFPTEWPTITLLPQVERAAPVALVGLPRTLDVQETEGLRGLFLRVHPRRLICFQPGKSVFFSFVRHMVRINLISSPRNISTALMYSFAQRSDTIVVDEPFYAYYLSIRPVDHPGREEVIASMETDQSKVVARLLGSPENKVLFIKNMAHHLIDIDERFLLNVTNVLLIRNPKQLISSFAQVIARPTMDDIGVRKQHQLFGWLHEKGHPPLVLDSGELLKDPGGVLGKLCSHVGLRFESPMLSWKPGPRPEDGVWAKYWYANVHRSSGFEVQTTSSRSLSDSLLPLYEEALPLYQTMFDHAIKAKD